MKRLAAKDLIGKLLQKLENCIYIVKVKNEYDKVCIKKTKAKYCRMLKMQKTVLQVL